MKELEQRLLALTMAIVTAVSLPASVVMNPLPAYANTTENGAEEADTISLELSLDSENSEESAELDIAVSEEMRTVKLRDIVKKLERKYGIIYGLSNSLSRTSEEETASASEVTDSHRSGASDSGAVGDANGNASSDAGNESTASESTVEIVEVHETNEQTASASEADHSENLNCKVQKGNGYLQFSEVKWGLSDDSSEEELQIFDVDDDAFCSYEFAPKLGDAEEFHFKNRQYRIENRNLKVTVKFVEAISYKATAAFDVTIKDNLNKYEGRPASDTLLSQFLLKAEPEGAEASTVKLSELETAEDLRLNLGGSEVLGETDSNPAITIRETAAEVSANADPKLGQKLGYSISGLPERDAEGCKIHYSIELNDENQVEENGKTFIKLDVASDFINPDDLVTAYYALSKNGSGYQAVLQGTTRIFIRNQWYDEGSDEVKAARPELSYSPYRYLDTPQYSYANASPYWELGRERLLLPAEARTVDSDTEATILAKSSHQLAVIEEQPSEAEDAFTDVAFDENGIKYIYLLKQHKKESADVKGAYITYYAAENHTVGTVSYEKNSEPAGSFIPNGASVYQLIKGQTVLAHRYQFKAAAHPNVNAVITGALSRKEGEQYQETGDTKDTNEFSEEHTSEELQFSASRYDETGKTIYYGFVTKSMKFRNQTDVEDLTGKEKTIYDPEGYAYQITNSDETTAESAAGTGTSGESAPVQSTGTTTFTLVGDEVVHVKQIISGKIEQLQNLKVRYEIRKDNETVWSATASVVKNAGSERLDCQITESSDNKYVSVPSCNENKNDIVIEFDVKGAGGALFPQYDSEGRELTYTVSSQILQYNGIESANPDGITGPDAEHKDALKKENGHYYGQHDETVRFYLGMGPSSVIKVENVWKVGPNRSARKNVYFVLQYHPQSGDWETVPLAPEQNNEICIPAQSDYVELSIPGNLSTDDEEVDGQRNYARLWQLASASEISSAGTFPEKGVFRVVETGIGNEKHRLGDTEQDELALSILKANADLCKADTTEINGNHALVNVGKTAGSQEESEYFYIQEVASKAAVYQFRLENRRVGVSRFTATVTWKDDHDRLKLRPENVKIKISGKNVEDHIELAGKREESGDTSQNSGLAQSLLSMFTAVRNTFENLLNTMMTVIQDDSQDAPVIEKSSQILSYPKYDADGTFLSYSMEVENQDSHYTGTAGEYYFKQRFLDTTNEADREESGSEERCKNGYIQKKSGLSFDTYQFDLTETLSGKVTPVFHILWKGDPQEILGSAQLPDIYSTLYRKVLSASETEDAAADSDLRNIELSNAENLGTKNHDYTNKGYTKVNGEYTSLWIDTYSDSFDRYDADGKEYVYFEVISTTKNSEYKISGGYKAAPSATDSTDTTSTDGKRYTFQEETQRSFHIESARKSGETTVSAMDVYAAPYKAKRETLSNDTNAADNAEEDSAISGTIVIRPMAQGAVNVNKSWAGNLAADGTTKIYPDTLRFTVQASRDGISYEPIKENAVVSDVYIKNQREVSGTTVSSDALGTTTGSDKISIPVPKYTFEGRKYQSYQLQEVLPEEVKTLYFADAENGTLAEDAVLSGIPYGGSANRTNTFKKDQGYHADVTVHWYGLTPEDLRDGTPASRVALLQYRSGESDGQISVSDPNARLIMPIQQVTPDGENRGTDANGDKLLQGTVRWEHLPRIAPDGKPYIYKAIEIRDEHLNGYSVYEGLMGESGLEKSTKTVDVSEYPAYPDGETRTENYKAHRIAMQSVEDHTGVHADFINTYNDDNSKNTLGEVTIQLHWPSLLFEIGNEPKKANRPSKVSMNLYRAPGTTEMKQKPGEDTFVEDRLTAVREVLLEPKKDDTTWETKADSLRIYDPAGNRYVYGVKLTDESRNVLTASNEILVNYGIASEGKELAVAFTGRERSELSGSVSDAENPNITGISLSEDTTTLEVTADPVEGDTLGIGQSVRGIRAKLQYRIVDTSGAEPVMDGWKDVKIERTPLDAIMEFFQRVFGRNEEVLNSKFEVWLNRDNAFHYQWTNLPIEAGESQTVEYRAVETGIMTETEESGSRIIDTLGEASNASFSEDSRFDSETAAVGGFRSAGITGKSRPSSVGHYRFATTLHNALPVASLNVSRRYLNEAKEGASDATESQLANTKKLRLRKVSVKARIAGAEEQTIYATESELMPEAAETAEWQLKKLPTVDAAGNPIRYTVEREAESTGMSRRYFSVCTISEFDEHEQHIASSEEDAAKAAVRTTGAMSGEENVQLRPNHTVEVAFTDTLARADLHFRKVNEDDAEQALAGSTYTLSRKKAFRDADDGHTGEEVEAVATAVTDANGEITFKDLVVGVDYILQETKAPSGYRVSKEPTAFRAEIREDGEASSDIRMEDGNVIGVKNYAIGTMKLIAVGTSDTASFFALPESKRAEVMRNSPVTMKEDGSIRWNEPPVRLSIEKRADREQGALLGGARLELRQVFASEDTATESELAIASWSTVAGEPTVIRTGETTADGRTIRLTEGVRYRLYEIEAPEGYRLAEPIEFTLEARKAGALASNTDTHYTVTMIDARIPAPHHGGSGGNSGSSGGSGGSGGSSGSGSNVHPGVPASQIVPSMSAIVNRMLDFAGGIKRLDKTEETATETTMESQASAPETPLDSSNSRKRSRTAKTGDSSHMIFYGVMCCASSAVLGMYFWLSKTSKRKKAGKNRRTR